MKSIYSTPGFPMGFMAGFVAAGALFLAVGCDENDRYTKSRNRVCSSEQIKELKPEYNVCDSSGYSPSYCWDIAKINHCSKVDSTKP